MPTTQIEGLGSGIQWKDTIDQLMAVESNPLVLKQQRVSDYNAQISAWDVINKQLLDLQSQMESMDTPDEFLKKRASSSDQSVTVTADADAITGTYDVRVNQLANGHKVISQGFSSLSETLFSGSGVFTYTSYDPDSDEVETVDIDVDENTTLSDLKRKINVATDSNVTASIMNDGDDANPYRLILTSETTGLQSEINISSSVFKTGVNNFRDVAIGDVTADSGNFGSAVLNTSGQLYTGLANNFSVEVSTTTGLVDGSELTVTDADGNVETVMLNADGKGTLANGVVLEFDPAETLVLNDSYAFSTSDATARNAELVFENITMTKSTNAIDDVIEGVTLYLNDVTDTGDTARITIENDKNAVKENIEDFVSKYNSVVDTISNYSDWDEELKEGAVLFTNSTAKGLPSDLSYIFTTVNRGISDDQFLRTLSQIGVEVGENNHLKIDSTKLNEAMDENYDEVSKLFTTNYNFNGDDADLFTYNRSTYDTFGGEYAIEVTVAGGKITSATIDGKEAKVVSGSFIEGIEGSTTEGLQIHVDTSNDGSFSTEFRFSTGKAFELAQEIESFTGLGTEENENGTIKTTKNSINRSIDSLNDQIETMQRKLEMKREMYEKQFLALETAMSSMQSQSQVNSAMMSGL